jgi:branched-chain amino acid transport system ATP-binding protein
VIWSSRLTILLVEQRVVEALELCDRGYVLETGRMVPHGPRQALQADPRVLPRQPTHSIAGV